MLGRRAQLLDLWWNSSLWNSTGDYDSCHPWPPSPFPLLFSRVFFSFHLLFYLSCCTVLFHIHSSPSSFIFSPPLPLQGLFSSSFFSCFLLNLSSCFDKPSSILVNLFYNFFSYYHSNHFYFCCSSSLILFFLPLISSNFISCYWKKRPKLMVP